jgi:hypothetical protein
MGALWRGQPATEVSAGAGCGVVGSALAVVGRGGGIHAGKEGRSSVRVVGPRRKDTACRGTA